MASKTDIANRALTKLGVARITSMDQRSKAAETLASMYDMVRKAELRANAWSFAKSRASLPALATGPDFGFRYAYQLPADFLRLIQIGKFLVYPRTDTRGLYSIEGREILTDIPAPLRLRYIRDIEDVTLFDALFTEAFACKLAIECAEDLTQVAAKKQSAQQDYAFALAAAVRANAVERPSQPIGDDSWLEARGTGSGWHHGVGR